MRYIVTGGAGLARTSQTPYRKTTTSPSSTTSPPRRRVNIEHLLDHPRVEFIEGSITDLDLLMETFPGAAGIFHQAAIPSVPRSVKDPLPSNVTGTLVAAKNSSVPAFPGSCNVHHSTRGEEYRQT